MKEKHKCQNCQVLDITCEKDPYFIGICLRCGSRYIGPKNYGFWQKTEQSKWNPVKIAFIARLAYERNCEAKYDRSGGPSRTPVPGERMQDYAEKYGCTIEEMIEVLPEVERFMEKT